MKDIQDLLDKIEDDEFYYEYYRDNGGDIMEKFKTYWCMESDIRPTEKKKDKQIEVILQTDFNYFVDMFIDELGIIVKDNANTSGEREIMLRKEGESALAYMLIDKLTKVKGI